MALIRKGFVIVIILLFVGTGFIPVTAQNTEESLLPSRGNWLYVGGSGPGNYSSIQDAIENASDGDTVFVYKGIYHENVAIYHMISVLGENKESTIIDGNESTDVVSITGNTIFFSGFTVRNSSLFGSAAGITVYGNIGYVEITDVYVTDNAVGILLRSGTGTKIHDTVIINNTETGVYVHSYRSEIFDNVIANNRFFGIVLLDEDVDDTIIKNNVITNSREGIWISDMYETSRIEISNNIIMNSSNHGITVGVLDSKIGGNYFFNNSIGLTLGDGQGNDIRGNTFQNNRQGLQIVITGNNRIHRNNFIQNDEDAFFSYFLFYHNGRNYWYHNYWDNHLLPIPKLIWGEKVFFMPFTFYNISWVQFDVFPALQPFSE